MTSAVTKPSHPNKLTADDLRQIRIRLGITIPDAAKIIGVDRATWWRWEEANVPVADKYYKGIIAMIESEGIPVGDVVSFVPNPNAPAAGTPEANTVQVPVYNPVAAAGAGLDITEEWVSGHIGMDVGYIKNVLQAQPTTLFAVVVDGDSMEPSIRSGEIAFVTKSAPGAPAKDGIHLLRMEGALLCKRIGRIPGHRLAVSSDNAAYPTFEIDLEDDRLDLAVIGRIVGVLRRL